MITAMLSARVNAQHTTDTSRDDAAYAIPILIEKGVCKGYKTVYFPMSQEKAAQTQRVAPPPKAPSPRNKPWLQVHGNILYDLNYRSNIDTPYAEKDVYQHTIQTYLDVTYKHNYPFRVYFTTRFSNSSLFRNYSDLNLLYNGGDFNNRVKRQVQSLMLQRPGLDSLRKLKDSLTASEKQYYTLKNSLNNSGQWQRIIAAREQLWLRRRMDSLGKQSHTDSIQLPVLDQLKKYKFAGRMPDRPSPEDSAKAREDSLKARAERYSIDTAALAHQYDSAKKRLDTLGARIHVLSKRYQELKELEGRNSDQAKKEIEQISSGNELKEKLKALHISDSSLPKGYRTLYSVKSFGIGRSLLDYSELSAKNISINGLQVEYNPSCYMALAAGTVDYRFRDYTMQNPQKGQFIGLIRYGWGRKDGNNLIFTYYTGKRQLYNANTTVQGAEIPNYNLMGFTIEGHYKINRTNTLIAEIAKSSSPYYSLDSSHQHSTLGSALKMNDRSNEAYSLKLNSFIPFTQTQFTASYRHFGANFQSFSLFTSGTEQSAWMVRADQPLFQRLLLLTAGIRTNDFANPLLTTSYKSNTVFKSIQATLRLKKWPTLSLGYFPSSQVTKISDTQFQENLFYTLTASASHTYKVKGISMISLLLYTQFYNKVTDTNFVYFNTKNLLFSQSAFIGRLTWQLQLSVASSTAFNLYVADNKADYRISSWLSLGAGIKYNAQTVYNVRQWGYSGNAALRVPRLGEFRLMADKGFIPGNNKQLVVNKIGRLTYSKVF